MIEIDPRLTEDCSQPTIRGDTWRDVGVLSIEQKAALEECTRRMRAIRDLTK